MTQQASCDDELKNTIRENQNMGMFLIDATTEEISFIHSLAVNVGNKVLGIRGNSLISEAEVIEIPENTFLENFLPVTDINHWYEKYGEKKMHGKKQGEIDDKAAESESSTSSKAFIKDKKKNQLKGIRGLFLTPPVLTAHFAAKQKIYDKGYHQ